jgi:hypothetical protein
LWYYFVCAVLWCAVHTSHTSTVPTNIEAHTHTRHTSTATTAHNAPSGGGCACRLSLQGCGGGVDCGVLCTQAHAPTHSTDNKTGHIAGKHTNNTHQPHHRYTQRHTAHATLSPPHFVLSRERERETATSTPHHDRLSLLTHKRLSLSPLHTSSSLSLSLSTHRRLFLSSHTQASVSVGVG